MSLELRGQNQSINENLTKVTSISTLQDTTPIVQQPPSTTAMIYKSPLITSSKIQNSQVLNSRIPTFKNSLPSSSSYNSRISQKTASSTVIKSSAIKDDSKDSCDNYEKISQNLLESNKDIYSKNDHTFNLGGDVSNLNNLNSSSILNTSESSVGVDIGTSDSTSPTPSVTGTTTSVSPASETPLSITPLIGTSNTSRSSRNTYNFHSQSVGLNGHLRRWHSSNSGLHYSKNSNVGSTDPDDIRTLYERWKLVLPKDDLVFDQFSSSVDSPAPPLSFHEIRSTITIFPHTVYSLKKKNLKDHKSGLHGCRQINLLKNLESMVVAVMFFLGIKRYFLVTNGDAESEFDDNLHRTYETLLTLPSQHEKQIDLDIPRTLHSHIMFRTRYGPGQRALFNVLQAFSNYNKQVGYCQGMTNIVTILLMYYTEECAFIMLTKLFTRCNLHNLFIPGFPALLESFYVQEKLLIKYAPKISSQFNKLQLSSTAYATRWYITLFTSDVVPHHTVLRIWDLLMLHGFDILYFVAVALLKYHKATLITSSFEHAMIMLSTTLVIMDDDKLIKKVNKMFNLKDRKGLIDTLKAEYRSQIV
ncbi:1120_t:CDS:2 [Scutellospora calospora]|uniref:1120_t:CDS:1 n=1 Tax=Scutellospora calospora TaxID=85575 RepID=A0ACA9K534_9GLOM|nr:1120_t:CDS:2 [Scutellospora calospora]